MEKLKAEYEQAINVLLDSQVDEEVAIEITDNIIIGLMLCKRLDRIAEVLEDLKPLADCVATDRGNHAFYIAGAVTSYEP